MEGEHEVELFFHCSERCSVEPAGGAWRASQEGGAIELRLPDASRLGAQAKDARVTVHRGSLAPIAGWISRGFDVGSPPDAGVEGPGDRARGAAHRDPGAPRGPAPVGLAR